jgi:S-DNA-T family DNA segregation ATPase FtsK/SpoIIIE
VAFKLKTSDFKASYSGTQNDIAKLNTVFNPYGLKVDDVIQAAQVVRYVIKLPLDVKMQGKIRRSLKDIEWSLSSALMTDNINFSHTQDSLIVERKGDFNILPFGNLYTAKFNNSTDGLMLMLGQDMNGKAVFTDLAKAPHILVAGTTGSGKTEVLHSIVASLLMRYCFGHNAPGIAIIDMKGTEFGKYKNTYPITLIKEADEAVRMLKTLVDIMQTRYEMIDKANCEDIDEYRRKGNRMQSLVCIIDELADLMSQNSSVENYIVRLAQKARACGIHLVLGTQSPRADVVTGLIKANIPFKIALNTANALDSRIILDENGAEKLFGKGDMLIKKGGSKPIHAQGCFVCDEDKIAIAQQATNGKHYDIFPKVTPTVNPTPTPTTSTPTYQPKKKKRVGLIQGMINLMRVKPIMFESDDYPPKI